MGALVADAAGDADVLVALATPPGVSALAVVRLTGPAGQTLRVAARLAPELGLAPAPRVARRLTLVDASGDPLDDAVAVYFAAPASATGEEVVELTCHGSPAVVRELLAAARSAGARPARPGEFSRRAFRHGKLDLAEAEGVSQLSAAESRGAARRALGLVRGELSARVEAVREQLLDLLARVEASLDFPEDELDPPVVGPGLSAVEAELARLVSRAAGGARGQGLPVVAVAGAPNAGKSSLFNALHGTDRTIVTPVPGTTRDVVAETVELCGESVRLLDTAGLRETDDPVERIGVEAARAAVAAADLVLLAVDATRERACLPEGVPPGRTILVRTKVDLLGERRERRGDGEPVEVLETSAVTGDGIRELGRAVVARLGLLPRDGDLLVLERHRAALGLALEAVVRARREGLPEEVAASELREALHRLGEVTGETATEDLLERVFSTFCVGK